MTEKVTVPWVDGTERVVDEGALILVNYDIGGRGACRAAKGGRTLINDERMSPTVLSWLDDEVKVSAVLQEAPEPPAKVELPKGFGAAVADDTGWRAIRLANGKWSTTLGALWEDYEIDELLLNGGAKIIFEGYDLNV